MKLNFIPFFTISTLIFAQSNAMQRSRYLLCNSLNQQFIKKDAVYFQKQQILELRRETKRLLQENKQLRTEIRIFKQKLLKQASSKPNHPSRS